ncbi:hypothetical protein SAMN06265365_102234 [Tistlia consotensis]|uniref:Methyltransferase domain-containing protein n=1 Tax=Tistlia consotensis USBA 355 TaxID=560819 RepID=A0A1Y6BEV9_9PROT|nr:hypothetical protein [Tistlia consotensis]SMF07666.1 hypothetical protein SAMN05428998_10482 [Tistlia consotensis USBA 355]SNR35761.1 hypothetical protein SAMN06265365_102234 [Tistlia consotensis]
MFKDLFGGAQRRRLEKRVERLGGQLEALRVEFAKEYKWRRRLEDKLDALLRGQQLASGDFADPHAALQAWRFGLTSQNEEDGLVLSLVRAMTPRDRRFVDIGCGRNGGNCGLLGRELGWSGLMLDASEVAIRQLGERLAGNRRVTALARRVTPETIDALLEEQGLTGSLDVFSLDIDSFDYWVLEAMTVAKPRLLIVEYNWLFGGERAVTVPRNADLASAPKGYHGASLAAFDKLLSGRGYRLVCVEPMGVNAFFLADGEATELPGMTAAEAYRPHPGRKTDKAGESRERPSFELPLVEV